MIQLNNPQKYQSRLSTIEKISSKVYFERFELVEPKEIAFLAGQTVMLSIAPGINRSMSIASAPAQKNILEFVHDITPMGPYAKWTLSAKVGDPMSLMAPLGNFICEDGQRKKIFVATGTGVAPFRSMILDRPTDTMELYWGLRHEEDIFWKDEFTSIPFHLILSQPSEHWKGERGHVQDHLPIVDADYYLCGNKQMVLDVRDKLKSSGVPDNQVKFELFY